MDKLFEYVDEAVFRAMQHRLVWQLLVQGKTPDEVREVVDFMPGFDMLTLQELATEHPDLHGKVNPALSDLLEHCKRCSEEVAKWPAWKQHGADVTKFQGRNNV